MTHRQKVDCLIAELRHRGVSRFTVAPPVFRLLWLFGLEVPPPLFLRYIPLALFSGVFFGFFWGLLMGLYFLMWLFFQEGHWHGHVGDELLRGGVFGLSVVAGVASIAGLLFGLTMATYTRWKAAKLGLPSWERYPEVEPEGDFANDSGDDF